MKRKKALALLALVCSMSLVACGGSAVSPEESAETEGHSSAEKVEINNGMSTEVPTLSESAEERAYAHGVEYGFTGDLAELFEELDDIDIDGDGLKDTVLRNADDGSGNSTSGIEFRFGNGSSVEVNGLQNAPNLDMAVTFRDIDGNGRNEILLVSYIESTAGPVVADAMLFRLEENEEWILYPLWDVENSETYMCDEDNLIGGVTGGAGVHVWDAELIEDGIVFLYDLGMKDGAEQTFDYVGVKGVLLEDEVEVVEVSKKIAEKYWPLDMKRQAFLFLIVILLCWIS